jgi:3-hydroxybutyryl-CoA dehydrogenase
VTPPLHLYIKINAIGIIGAGPSGRAIAYLSALSGYRTILEAVSQEFLDDALVSIRELLDEREREGSLTVQQKAQALANLCTSRSVEDVCREADLLIEAAQEEMEVKLEIFTLFDKFAKPAAILASSSPTIPIDELAEITFRAEDCIGLRFRDPLSPLGVLEIIRTAETSETTVEACLEVGKRMGRELILSRI